MKTRVLQVHPVNDQELNAIKDFCKAHNIEYKLSNEVGYDPDFVAKVEESREQYKKGEFISVKKKDIKSFLRLENLNL